MWRWTQEFVAIPQQDVKHTHSNVDININSSLFKHYVKMDHYVAIA